MKLQKILLMTVHGNAIKALILLILLTLPSILSGQDETWKYYEYAEPNMGFMKLDGDTLWLGSDIGLVKLNTATLSEEIIKPATSLGRIRCLEIDKQKNIWVGSLDSGLVKFNGKSWTVYDTTNSGLPSNWVKAVSVDKLGNVWIGTSRGLAKFDGSNWKTYKLPGADSLDYGICALCIDSSNNVWAAGFGRLHKFDGTNWKVYDGANWGWPSDGISAMKSDSAGKLWIATVYGLYSFDGTSWGKIQVPYLGMNNGVTLDKQGNVILIGSEGSYIYSRKTSTGRNCIYNGYDAVPDPKGYIWWTYRGSLFRMKDDFSTSLQVKLPLTLPGRNVRDIAFDLKGYTWIATDAELARYDGKEWTRYEYFDSSSTTPRDVTALAVGLQGELWIGTKGNGLYLYDGVNWENFNKSNSGMKSDIVRTVAVDQMGNVWIGTYGGGLMKYDGTNWQQLCPYNDIYSIAVDSKGAVWVGTDGGLDKIEGNSSANFNTSNAGLPGNFIYSLAVDKQDNIWFLSNSHRDYYNGYLMKFDGQSFSKPEIPGISYKDYITDIAVDAKGTIWAGHYWDGIYKYDGSNWTQLNTSNSGLKYGNVGKIIIDKYGNKWIAYVYEGLSVYNENGILSAVEGEKVSGPKEYLLAQNYPNPFNPVTNISYSLPVSRNVKLTVYDMLGKEITTLVNEFKSAGTYKVQFNGSNLPSGVYIYTIQAGEFRDSKKLVLLK